MTRDRARALRDSGGMSPAISRQASGAARTRQSEVLRLQGLAGNSAVTGMLTLQRDAATVTPDSPASTKANPDPLAVVAAAFPTAMAIAGQLEPILRLAGADLAPLAIGALVANGFRDESKLTDVAFWLHHPEMSGEALKPGLPGYPSLAKDWIDLRTSVVRPALEVRDASPQVVQSHPAPGEGARSAADHRQRDRARAVRVEDDGIRSRRPGDARGGCDAGIVREVERGPRLARVEEATVSWRSPSESFTSFGVRYSGDDA